MPGASPSALTSWCFSAKGLKTKPGLPGMCLPKGGGSFFESLGAAGSSDVPLPVELESESESESDSGSGREGGGVLVFTEGTDKGFVERDPVAVDPGPGRVDGTLVGDTTFRAGVGRVSGGLSTSRLVLGG